MCERKLIPSMHKHQFKTTWKQWVSYPHIIGLSFSETDEFSSFSYFLPICTISRYSISLRSKIKKRDGTGCDLA